MILISLRGELLKVEDCQQDETKLGIAPASISLSCRHHHLMHFTGLKAHGYSRRRSFMPPEEIVHRELPAPSDGLRRFALAGAWFVAIAAFLAAIVARAAINDLPLQGERTTALWIIGNSLVVTAIFWGVVYFRGDWLAARMGVPALAMIGVVSALHFVIATSSRVLGQVWDAMLGPFAVFIKGIGDEGLPCLLVAVVLILRPKPGTVGLSLLSVFMLMVITSGTLGPTAFIFISLSVVLHESALALLGITTTEVISRSGLTPPWHVVARVALGIGLANGAALYIQFYFYRLMFGLYFDSWYIQSVAGVTGVLYGAIGAALGTILGYRLRRTAA